LELTCIGEIQTSTSTQSTITLIDWGGQKMNTEAASKFRKSFDHFA